MASSIFFFASHPCAINGLPLVDLASLAHALVQIAGEEQLGFPALPIISDGLFVHPFFVCSKIFLA